MKKDDIFRWSFTDEYLETHKHEPYWCKSRIAVFNGDRLIDTFWSTSDHVVDEEDVELEFVANFDELIEKRPSERAYYLDKDCVDLNHPNSTRGNFYIRKGAEKNIEKMERILKREKRSIEKSIEHQLSNIERLKEYLLDVNSETYINTSKGVSLEDESYLD